jgi:HD superfamily phosphohydrolase
MIKIINKTKYVVVYDDVWAPLGFLIKDIKIIKLLETNAINNLKYLSQNGASNYIMTPFGKKSKVTRFDHSIGCMILTLKVGGTIDDAIVALLHDVMHLPFSHTIDHLLGSESESYHEQHKDSLLEKYEDEFIKILGDDWKKYFNEERFPIVKLNNPFAIDVCDYTMRDLFWLGIVNEKTVQKCLLFTTVDNGYLKCLNKETKKIWKRLSKIINDTVYAASWNFADNYYFSESIKVIIERGEITKNEIINYDSNTECNIYEKIKDIFIEKTKGKKFLLLISDSYDAKIYTKIKKMKIRYRYMNPTMINSMPKKVQGLFVDMDLVSY